MYSNDKKGFSILDLLVKIIFAGVFIFILIWLFQKKVPNMTPFYSNVFRENIKYMQDAGENYFTDDKMPTTVGETYKLTLEEMEKLNLIIPFVDKDGKACNKTESYVSVTKLEGSAGYELKTNLVCDKEANFVNKILGCHNYCENNCGKTCSVEKITEYEFKKLISGSTTKYSCDKGYTLKGKYCIKKTLKDSYSAAYTTTETKTTTKPAKMVQGDAKLKQLPTTVKDKTTQLKTVETTKTTELQRVSSTTSTELTVIVGTTTQTYSCQKEKTERQCKTETQKVPRQCNCKIVTINGVPSQTCDVCYDYVQVETCKDVTVTYTGTCTKQVKTYTCPSGTTRQTGSGSSLKCYKDTTTYSCPSGTTSQTGSGSSLKCYKTEKVYSCPSGTTSQTGSGSSLKCYKTEKVYSCPTGTDVQEGSGSSLKCFQIISGTITYKCDAGYKLNGKTCTKTETVTVTKYKCTKKGYVLENKKCNLYDTKKVKATAKKIDTSSYEYKWSREKELAGWTRTGKTRTVDGKEICK